jgi:hypothetical protein
MFEMNGENAAMELEGLEVERRDFEDFLPYRHRIWRLSVRQLHLHVK